MKKSQIIGQVFIYIMSAILVSLILVFGYKAINIFMKQSCEFKKINFLNDFDSTLNKMTYQDTQTKSFDLPCNFNQLCFVSKTKPLVFTDYKVNNSLVKSQWQWTSNNVFLANSIMDLFYFKTKRTLILDMNRNGKVDSTEQSSNPSFLCLPSAGGSVTLRLEDKGKDVFLSDFITLDDG